MPFFTSSVATSGKNPPPVAEQPKGSLKLSNGSKREVSCFSRNKLLFWIVVACLVTIAVGHIIAAILPYIAFCVALGAIAFLAKSPRKIEHQPKTS